MWSRAAPDRSVLLRAQRNPPTNRSGHALKTVFLLPLGEMVYYVAGVSAHGEQGVR